MSAGLGLLELLFGLGCLFVIGAGLLFLILKGFGGGGRRDR